MSIRLCNNHSSSPCAQGFTDNECYHQFCRLLGRLKASYQLSELVRADGYSRWIELSAEFAIKSFGQMDVSTTLCITRCFPPLGLIT